MGRFPPACEKIIKGVKKSNKSRPKSKRANPFAIAQANPTCRKALDLPKLKLDDLQRMTKKLF